MVFHWETVPLLRILLPFTIGILLFINFDLSDHLPSTYFLGIIALCSLVLLFLHNKQKQRYRYRWIFGAVLAFIWALVGFERTKQSTEIWQKTHFSRFLEDSTYVLMQLETPIEEKEKTFKAEVKIVELVNDNQLHRVLGKALVYFQKSEDAATLKYGDRVLTNSRFKQLKDPKNPHAFDYAAYMRNFQVYHQSYIRHDQWQKIAENHGHWFFKRIYKTRQYFLEILEEKAGSQAEIGVASAILLGNKAKLDEEVRDTYANTGSMHILAVSGLHVGIIFIIVSRLLFFLEKIHRWGKILKFVLVILVIWGYAFITGLPPSVFRAATMFSIFAIGELKNQKAFSFNALAASALLLLYYNPYMIKMLGFQLSYAAVAAIMWLQGPIYRLIEVKNRLLNYIWKISSVSIAAQLGTIPLTVYYFHQFPTYFWLSNLVVIPSAGLILGAGIVLLLVGNVAYLGDFVGTVLQLLIKAVYRLLQLIEYLPFSVIEGLVITDLQFWFLYGGMVTTVFFFVFNHLRYLQWTLATLLVIMGSYSWKQFHHLEQKQMVVYHVPKGTAIEFIVGNQSHLVGNESLLKEKKNKAFQYNIAPNQLMSNIEVSQTTSLSNFNDVELGINNKLQFQLPFIQFSNRKILLLDNTTVVPDSLNKKLKVDYLILTQNARINLQRTLDWIEAKQVIFDASNSYRRVKRWKSECELHGLNCHDVYEKGAFVADF